MADWHRYEFHGEYMSNHKGLLFLDARCFSIGVAFCVLQGVALAQTPDLRSGNFELGLFAGASYGVDAFRVMGGANLSYSLPKLLLPYVEFSYFPELIRNYNTPNDNFVISAKIEDIHGGVHIRLLPHESRVVPYAVVGFGVLHSNTTGQDIPTPNSCISAVQTTPCTAAQLPKPTPIAIVESDPAVNFGAGLRVYHTSYLGYRVEFKEYRPLTGQFDKFFSKVEGGIFFQFGGH
jgi:hypothetical protein